MPIAFASFTLLLACGLPAHAQQSSPGNNTPAYVEYSQNTVPVLGVLGASQASPTPEVKARKNPTAQPGMTGMKPSGDASSEDAGMGGGMMGEADLTPPGIMVGQAGRWMVGYQFMFDKMDGNLVGTNRISDAAILDRFMATPTDMTMQMHMGWSCTPRPTDSRSWR